MKQIKAKVLVAFDIAEDPRVIEAWSGSDVDSISDWGADFSEWPQDLDLLSEDRTGLWLWSGIIEVDPTQTEEENDGDWIGKWRRLTPSESLRVAKGESILD